MTRGVGVSVSGRGAVCGFGAGLPLLVDRVFAGDSAVLARRRTADYYAPTTVASEVPRALSDTVSERDLPLALARMAAREALAEAGTPDAGSIGLVLATTKADLSGMPGQEGDGLGLPARLAERLRADLGLSHVTGCVSAACASGLEAVAFAARRIARGEEQQLLVVGVDILNRFVLAGFGSLHALDPAPCRPFDVQRRGVSLGEGAGAILLSARPADSLGFRILGHGGANDALHVTRPDPDGHGLELAARRALRRAGVGVDAIDFVNLHGTGTVANDVSEANALVRLFGGPTPPAFGTKAQIGHTLGASGVLETLLTLAALERAELPRNVGLEQSGVDADLDLVQERRPLGQGRRALKVAGGFGGIQAALVLERVGGPAAPRAGRSTP